MFSHSLTLFQIEEETTFSNPENPVEPADVLKREAKLEALEIVSFIVDDIVATAVNGFLNLSTF